jgi:hypothetical protein
VQLGARERSPAGRPANTYQSSQEVFSKISLESYLGIHGR